MNDQYNSQMEEGKTGNVLAMQCNSYTKISPCTQMPKYLLKQAEQALTVNTCICIYYVCTARYFCH